MYSIIYIQNSSFHSSFHLSTIHPPTHQSIFLSIHPSFHLSPIHPPVKPSIFSSTHPPVFPSIYPSIHSSVCLLSFLLFSSNPISNPKSIAKHGPTLIFKLTYPQNLMDSVLTWSPHQREPHFSQSPTRSVYVSLTIPASLDNPTWAFRAYCQSIINPPNSTHTRISFPTPPQPLPMQTRVGMVGWIRLGLGVGWH